MKKHINPNCQCASCKAKRGELKGNNTSFYKRKHSESTKEKIRKSKLGKTLSEEHKKSISEGHKNKFPSKETRYKLSEARKGSKNPNWKNGLSLTLYTVDWTETLKRSIRERDKYTCRICNSLQGDITFDVHHIDYCKSNCNPNNLITLCKICHMKTNYNREYWTEYLNNIIK